MYARTHTHTRTHASPILPLPQAIVKKEDNKVKEAKKFSIISFTLVLIFAVSYPILVAAITLASVFGTLYRPYYYYRRYY